MSEASDPRWVRNKALSKMIGVTELTINRWQKNPEMGFPQPSVINGFPYTNVAEVEKWMQERAAINLIASAANSVGTPSRHVNAIPEGEHWRSPGGGLNRGPPARPSPPSPRPRA